MARAHPDDKILSYNDVVLRRSDLDILKGPHFLNDRIVEFYFSYLSSTCVSCEVLLVPPSISFWISNCTETEHVKDVVGPLNFQDRQLIVFSVNDNEDVTMPEGGSHWSLLVYYRKRNLFEYYDSYQFFNKRYARKLYEKIRGLVGAPARPRSRFCECNTPQQTNGYDCGLYILAIAEALYRCHLREPNDDGLHRLEAVISLEVGNMRSDILKIIEGLIEQRSK